MIRLALATLAFAGPFSCEQDEPPPPPPPTSGGPQAAGGGGATVQITVTATSNPPGALVNGGGRQLGVTPLTTQVPIPVTPPGAAAPSFDFVFTKEGYQSTTLQAAPVNGQIAITAALAPLSAAPTTPTSVGGSAAGQTLEVVGTGGGRIRDMRTTTATATVTQACVIKELTVTLNGSHSYMSDLVVRLRAPSGEDFTLQSRRSSNPFRRHVVRRAQGQQAQGEWRVSVRDTVAQDFGRLTGFRMNVECQ